MRALSSFVTGRRTKWAVVAGWIALLAAFAPLGAKLADVTDNRTETFLPDDAESTAALRLQEQRFGGGQTVSGLIVYRRSSGLVAADLERIARDARRAAAALPLVGEPVVPFQPGAPPELVARDGDAAYTVLAVPDDNDRLADWGTTLREVVRSGEGDGLDVYVTGGLGFTADFEEIFA